MPEFSRREALLVAGAAAVSAHLPAVARSQPASPKPGPAQDQPPGFYRFKVGAIDAVVFHDGATAMSPVQPTFAPEGSADAVKQTLTDAFLPADRVPVQFSVLAVKAAEGWVLLDAGFGPGAPAPVLGRLIDNMAAAGLKPADIAAVIISHAHGDHINGLVHQGQLVFPNARVVINKAEHDFWMNTGPEGLNNANSEADRKATIESARRALVAAKSKLELVAPGDRVFKQIDLVGSAGHTPGHISAFVNDGSASLCAIGDLAHHHVLMFAHPEWTVRFDVNPKAAAAARKTMFDRLAADKTRVFGFHLPWPGLGRIGRHGEGYWWASEPWAWSAQ